MKLPIPLSAAFRVIDGALSIAIKVDAWLRERKQRDPKGLRYQDVKRMNDAAHAAGHERRSAKTVVLPRKP